MRKRLYQGLIAGLLCTAMLFADMTSAGLLSLAAESENAQEAQVQTEAADAQEDNGETAASAFETETPAETQQEPDSTQAEEDLTQEESAQETSQTQDAEEDASETADSSASETEETEETETQAVLHADGTIASGVIDEDYGHITWVIDADGALTVSGTGDYSSPDSYGNAPWFAYREDIKSAKVDVTNMTDASYMFDRCTNITSIDLSSFDTSNVTKMNGMFFECSSLSSLDLSSFDTSNVTKMNGMFFECSSLSYLDLSSFVTSNVSDMSRMFESCSSLSSLNLAGFITSNVSDMGSMFEGCSSLSSLDLTGFVTSNVSDMRSMFSGCSSLSSLDLSGFDTSNVSDMYHMFEGCSSLSSLDLSNFDTSNITDMFFMFHDCSSLSSLDLSSFDTSNITNMGLMFGGCSSLSSLDLSSFDTSNVTDMGGMFYDCSSLSSLDLSSFDTSNVTDMESMFSGCNSLSSLDLSSFDTSNVPSMQDMFGYCSSLSSLNLSGFDTSNLTSMQDMFWECNSLSSLNLSSFDASNVTDMSGMFSGCINLSTLYTPLNVKCSAALPPASVWYRSDGTTVTELPQNLSYSVVLGKNYIPKETETETKSALDVIALSQNECTVYVYDVAALKPIKNAKVTIDGVTQTTNAKGVTDFTVSDEAVKKEIVVTADGYNSITTYQKIKNKQAISIGLDADTDVIKIIEATAAVGEDEYDLLREKLVLGYAKDWKKVSNVEEKTLTLTVKANTDNVTYELIATKQNLTKNPDAAISTSDILLTSSTGTFSINVGMETVQIGKVLLSQTLLTSLMLPEKSLYVRATDKEGNVTIKKLSLSTTYNYITQEITEQKGEFQFGKKIKITAPDDMPFLGGTEVSLGFDKNFPLELEIDEDGKIKIAYNKPTDTTMEDFGKQYMVCEQKYKGLDKKVLRQLGKKTTFGVGMVSVDGKICGYGETNLSEVLSGNATIKLGIMAEIEGSAKYTHYWIVGYVPVKIFAEISATGSASVEGALAVESWKIKDFDLSGGSLGVTVALTAGAGVGLSKYIYELEVSMTGSLNYLTKPARGYEKVWVEASGRIARTALYFFEKPLWKSDTYQYTLYQKGTDTSKNSLALTENNAGTEDDGFQLMSRNYLSYASGYNELGQTVELKSALVSNTQSKSTVIQSAVLPSTIPTLIETGGVKYLFWADDVSSRDDYNRTALFYAKSTDGTSWSAPERLLSEEQDNTADFSYDVFADNGKIYIVWQDAARQLTAEDSLEDMFNSLSVRYTVLDTTDDKVTDGGQLTENAGCYLYPCTVTAGGKTYFAYAHNLLNTGDIDGNNTHRLYLVMPDGAAKEVTLPAKAQITGMDAGIFNGTPSLVCTVDTDGDISTESDIEIYVCSFADASLRQITDNDTADTNPVIADSGKLYWLQDGAIMKLSSLTGTPASIWNEQACTCQSAFTAVTDSTGKDTLLWEAVDSNAEDGSVSIFQTSEESGGGWSDVVLFAKTTGTIASRISAAGSGDSLLAAHAEGIFLEDGTRLKDLCVTAKETIVDTIVEYVDFDETQAAAGNALTLTAGVTNNGNTVIDRLTVSVSGNTVTTLTGLNLKPYESRELEITGFRVPSTLKKSTTYTLKLTAPNETDTADNTADFVLGSPDIYIEAGHRIESGRTWLDFSILNATAYEASGTVLVHKGYEDGEVIYNEAYTALGADNGYAYSIDLGDYENTYTKYYVEVTSNTTENNTGNNMEFVYIGYGTGIEQEEQVTEAYEISAVKFDSQALSLNVGGTAQLTAKDNKGNAFNTGELLWTTSDKRIAGVDQTGLITAYRSGTAKITAYYSDLSCSCIVTVAGDTDASQSGIRIIWLDDSKEYAYTGAKILPRFEVRDYDIDIENGVLLTPGTDYTVKYANNVKVGENTASVTVTGKGNYAGSSAKIYFSIVEASVSSELTEPANLKGAKIGTIAAQTYTGSAIYPNITLTLKGCEAVEYTYAGSAYRSTADNTVIPAAVAVSNNLNKGTATILLTGAAGSNGKATTLKKTFKITALDLSKADSEVKVTAASGVYAVKGASPSTLTVTYDGKTLIKGRDYTVKYSANKKATNGEKTAKAVITGKGNYTKKLTAYYAIEPLNLSDVAISAVTAYDGMKAGKVKAVVLDKDRNALKTSQYTLNIYKDKSGRIPYEANELLKADSTIYVKAAAKDTVNLKAGTKTELTAFSVGVNIAKAVVTDSTTKGKTITRTYTGQEIALSASDLTVTVKINGVPTILEPDTDYIVTAHSNNINKGTATAVIQGIGTYSGTRTVKFKITAKTFSLTEWINKLLFH